MQEKESRNNISFLIRDGAGEGNILRIKSSVCITEQANKLISASLSKRINKLPEEIGALGRILISSIPSLVPRVKTIRFKPKQVIFDIGVGNIWTRKEETVVIGIVDIFFASRSIATRWSIQRKVGELPKPL